MKKLSDEYSLDDWRRFEPDTAYAMLCAHERAREQNAEFGISLMDAIKAALAAEVSEDCCEDT